MQTQATGDNGAARPPRFGGDPSERRRRPGPGRVPRPEHAGLAALADDLDRLAEPLPPGVAIVDPSRPSHPDYQDETGHRSAAGQYADAAHLPAPRRYRAPAGPQADDAVLAGGDEAGAVTAPDAGAPVFVDSSGNRRKLARRLSIGVVGVLGGYACLLAVSFAGGPIPPAALLPVPGVPDGKGPAQQHQSAAPAGQTPTSDASSGRSGHLPGAPAGHSSGHSAGSPGSTVPGVPGSSLSPTGSLPATPQPSGTSPVSATSSTHGNPSAPGRTKHSRPGSGPTT